MMARKRRYPEDDVTVVEFPAYRPPRRRRRGVPAWAKKPLSQRELYRLLADRRGLDNNTMLRAMGVKVPARTYNPRRSPMVRRRRRRNPASPARQTFFRFGPRKAGASSGRRPGGGSRYRAGYGPLMASGVFDPASIVTFGRRARGRKRARVYGPVMAPSLYRPRRRKKAASRKRAKRRTGRMPAGLARYWRAQRAKARKASKPRKRAKRRTGYKSRAARRWGLGPKFRGRRTKAYQRRTRRRAHRRSKKHLRALTTIWRGQRIVGRVVRNPRTGRYEVMSTRALVANPRRRRRRRGRPSHHRRHRSHRRRRSRARRTINGGGLISSAKSIAKSAIGPAIAATAGGAIAGLSETLKYTSGPITGALAKALIGIAGAAVLRRKPAHAWAFFGASFGLIGAGVGLRIGGGLKAGTKSDIFKGIADLAADDGEMAALLAGAGVEDIGDLVQLGEVADDEDAMGDLVEQVAGLGDSDDDVGDSEYDEAA